MSNRDGIKKPKKSDKARITFFGKSAETVTGSCTLIQYKNFTIALDMGGFQGQGAWKDYQINKNLFKDFNVREISAVLLSHAHFDHVNCLSMMFNQGGSPMVYMPKGNYGILDLMFKDSCKINTTDCISFSKKTGKDIEPLFTLEDVESTLDNSVECRFGERFRINQFMEAEFISSGHIYASAQIIVYIEDGKYKKKILYSVDMGNSLIKKPLVQPVDHVKYADLMILETTYASTENKATMKHRREDLISLKRQIDRTCGRLRSTCLVGVFSLQRSLDVLMDLYEIWEKDSFSYPIYLDSPLAINILKEMEKQTGDPLFEKLNNWKNLHYIDNYNDTKEILYAEGEKIVLASSAFAMGGKILTYMTETLPNKKDCLITVGFASESSTMGKVKRRETIQIMHESELKDYEVKCEILSLQSYSSHMQNEQLEEYALSVTCNKLVCVHGEPSRKYAFAETIQEKYENIGKSTQVFVVMQKEYIEL